MPMKRYSLMILLSMPILAPASLAQTPALLPFQVDLVEVTCPEAPAMTQYDTARMILFDGMQGNLYTDFFGGTSYGVFDPDGDSSAKQGSEPRVPYGHMIQVEPKSAASGFRLDPNIPFIDQTTAFRVLKPGGRFICLTPNGHYLWYRWPASLFGVETRRLSTDWYLSRRQLAYLLPAAGFRDLVFSYWTFIPRGDLQPMHAAPLDVLDHCGTIVGPDIPRGGLACAQRYGACG